MSDLVPNPYRAAIASQRARALPVAADLRDDLAAAVTAMEAGAWMSSVADDFYAELAGHKQALALAGDGAMATFDAAMLQQPEQVEPDAWQIRWRNLR